MIKRILVTGGTGSFGGAVVRKLLKDTTIKEVVIFSRDEDKQHSMRQFLNSPKLKFIIGDVRDREVVMRACGGIDAIFHASALKQVPTGEYFPMELIKTNILGTQNVFDAAEKNKVKKVVLLSTDKAVYPVNAMGMSKALAEKLMSAKARESKNTVFCAVRYGNVMTTRGSVIPLFINRIKRGLDLTITNPAMTRFMLTLDDATSLVLFALKHGEQGDIFVKKSPATTVANLSQALLNVFKSKQKTKVTGIRAGEKIHETLAHKYELARSEDMEGYFRIKNYVENNSRTNIKVAKDINGDYTSNGVKLLSVPEVEVLLLSQEYVQDQLNS